MKKILLRCLRTYPWLYWRLKLWNHEKTKKHENELRLLPALANRDLDSIDIGASGGIYTLALLPYSRRIISFEPRTEGLRDLAEMTRVLKLPIQIEQVALSDREGNAELRMLVWDLGRSTIATENSLIDADGSPTQTILVKKKALDSYCLTKVGFIKIDVEGHEEAVLEGATTTINKSRCNLLIEMEERHCQGVIKRVNEFLEARSYEGFFLDENEIIRTTRFTNSIHQNPANIGGWKDNWRRKGKYINNFIFVPKDNKENFLKKSKALGFNFRKEKIS